MEVIILILKNFFWVIFAKKGKFYEQIKKMKKSWFLFFSWLIFEFLLFLICLAFCICVNFLDLENLMQKITKEKQKSYLKNN